MEDNGSAFFLNNQSAAGMMYAMHAAANFMEKYPASIPNTNIPFYVTPAILHSNQHHTCQVSNNSPQMAPTSAATSFSINDILSRTDVGPSAETLYGDKVVNDFKLNQTPNFASTMATMGSSQEVRRYAANAAVMLFNNHHEIGCHGNQQEQMKFTGKPQNDLPGRPPIFWPGVLTKDLHEKMGING